MKAAEPEGPWTPQSGKNTVREGETKTAADEGAGRKEAVRQVIHTETFFFSSSNPPSLQTHYISNVILLVWVKVK